MTAMKPSQSTAETVKQLKTLLKPLKEERADAIRLDDLRRLFAQQDMSPATSTTTPAVQKWKAFLSTHLDMFVAQLMDRMERKTAVRTFWGVIAACPSYTNQQHPFVSQSLLQRWFSKLPPLGGDRALRHMVESEFLHQYVDVQYYAYIALEQLATHQYQRDKMDTDAAALLFQLLTMLPRLKSQDDVDRGTYLFQPPTSGKPEEEEDNGDDDDDDDQNSQDEDDDSSGSDSDDDDESAEEQKKPVPKKQKLEPKIVRVFQYQQLKAHRRVMARAWLAILKLTLPLQDLKHALQALPTLVLPYIPNPLRFADFFVQAYGAHSDRQGSVVPILALDGLFILMMDHGLEYPLFYGSLYRLIQPSLFYVKYRIRFFELLIKCLTKNEMLPAHVVAAFIKRLARAALQAPPSGCLFALALISNLLRKHPECACLIHRSLSRNDTNNNNDDDDKDNEWKDAYDAATDDPTQSHALESSLWECQVLSKHYLPAVATMAQSIGQEEGPLHDMSDFLSHTYKSLFDQERKRLDAKKQKKVPLAFQKPTALFVEDDVFEGMVLIPKASLTESKD
ncbi:CBF/Mak21 family [Fragilaria crotonensis]|nr:CBF/Mak21 family [Fragilaria crotonensis]